MKKRVKRKGRKKGPENKVGKIIEREEKRKKNGFKMTEGNLFQSAASASAQSGATSMGKGAWDCDSRKAIPPEKEVREKNTRKRGEEEAVEREGRKKQKNRRSKKKTRTGRGLRGDPHDGFPLPRHPHGAPQEGHDAPGEWEKERKREKKQREREKKQRERETERERTEDNSLEKRRGKKTLSPSRLSSAGAAAIASPPSPRGPPRLSSAPSGQAGSRGPTGRTAGGARPGRRSGRTWCEGKRKRLKGKAFFVLNPQ